MGPVPHPGNMTNAFNFRNRPFERNPTTWVPSAPMRNGKDTYPKKLEKEWIKWLFQRKSLKINQRIGFCHFGFFGTFLTTFSLELLYELVDSMSTSFQASKARPKDKIIHITMTLITILLNTICIFLITTYVFI